MSKLGFELTTNNSFMAIVKYINNKWEDFYIEPYKLLEIYPGATILNYGQGIFEGIKAYKTNKNNIVIFRPDMNYQRLIDGCYRLLMPILSYELYINMLNDMVKSNNCLIPEIDQGAFYIRPLLFGSGQSLKLEPSNEYTFIIYGSPIGNYFNNKARLLIETTYIRSIQPKNKIGIGNIKYNGNYAQCFLPLYYAKKQGYSDILYINEDNTICETCSSNFFIIDKNNVLITPESGNILPGITRNTIINLIKILIKYNKLNNIDSDISDIKIGPITFEDILQAKEAFLTGTAVCITPIEHINTPIGYIDFNDFYFSNKIKNIYKDIINQKIELDSKFLREDWLYIIK
jgi:branched-chain amino acid aminotransferase